MLRLGHFRKHIPAYQHHPLIHYTARNGERSFVTPQMNNQPRRVGIAATITALQMAKWAQSDEDDDDDDGEGEEATEEELGAAL